MIAGLYGQEAADGMTIQYGGSMNAKNADELLAQPDVDGGLIGGAVLEGARFRRDRESGFRNKPVTDCEYSAGTSRAEAGHRRTFAGTASHFVQA